jgi:hypothetical protein
VSRSRHRFAVLATIAALAAPAAWAGDFEYAVPPGWWDLLHMPLNSRDRQNIPVDLLQQARNPRYVALAVDGDITRDTYGATFNAIEGPAVGHVTAALAQDLGERLMNEMPKLGAKATLVDTGVDRFGDVRAGWATLDVRGPRGVFRMREYLVNGHNSAALLAYSAPIEEWDHFLPVFEASVSATKGSYDPGSPWLNKWLWWGAAALTSMAVTDFMRRRREKAKAETGDADEAPVAAKVRAPSKHVWYCADCNNPVPMRLEQCRCGGKKPA